MVSFKKINESTDAIVNGIPLNSIKPLQFPDSKLSKNTKQRIIKHIFPKTKRSETEKLNRPLNFASVISERIINPN